MLSILLLILIKNGVIHEGISPVFAHDSCDSNWDCRNFVTGQGDQVCCKGNVSDNINNTQDEFHCLPRPWKHSPFDWSCFGFYCTRLSDCGFLEDGRPLCCVSNECRLCERCTYGVCNNTQLSCCGRLYFDKVCSDSCLGEWCSYSSNCGHGECCRSRRCSNCTDLGCTDHQGDCPVGHHCCDRLNQYGNRSCKTSCVGESCSETDDCMYPEYCKNDLCHLPEKCETDADCKNGSHKCCPLKSNRSVKLCALDCDDVCIKDDDCGSHDARPNQCCYGNSCDRCYFSCRSSSDCLKDYCCNAINICSDGECYDEMCVVTSDCRKPGRFCTNGMCDVTQQCNSSADCITSDGQQYTCCFGGDPPYFCGTYQDCYLADLDNTHENPSGGSNHFPNWLFGLLGGFLVIALIVSTRCYFVRKKPQQLGQNTIIADCTSERQQNIANEMQFRFEHGDPNLPPYIPNNPLDSHSNVEYNPNIPPPPYSFDDDTVSPDRNNDPPPQYRLIQL